MQPIYILLGGIIGVMTLFSVPAIINDARRNETKNKARIKYSKRPLVETRGRASF